MARWTQYTIWLGFGGDRGVSGKVVPVRVAVRIRPVVQKEVQDGCQPCLDVTPGEPHIGLSGSFRKVSAYDFAFDSKSQQKLYARRL